MGCSNSTPSSVADEDGGTQQESVVNAIYYPNWKVYSGKQPAAVDLACVSHVFYAFALVQEDGTVYLSDSWADVEMPLDDGTHGCLTYFARQKRQYKGLRLVLSIGGANGSGHFASIAADGDKTARFIESARELAEAHGLDGFDSRFAHHHHIGHVDWCSNIGACAGS
ncbi:hypothetical protein KEM52_001862 [Ascosphaera acerosa]|nr:hypothetical protein KEM52_001862 [Ascosphaera acerosa]